MVKRFARLLRHLALPRWQVRRVFPAAALERIEAEIAAAEATHAGQICFAVEGALDFGPLLAGISARERALEAFAQLRVWDTEQNNGVLVYVLLADHDVEIVADRGIDRHVGAAEWERICHAIEQDFRAGRFEAGVITGIREISAHLARHFPRTAADSNELPDRPFVI